MHKQGLIHRDVKMENVLCRDDGCSHVVLVDHGYVSGDKVSNVVLGTPGYFPPQMFAKEDYGFEVDWWSFGILAYAIRFRHFPYPKHPPVRAFQRFMFSEGFFTSRQPFQNSSSTDLKDLIVALIGDRYTEWQRPDNRKAMSTSDPMRHPILRLPYWTASSNEGLTQFWRRICQQHAESGTKCEDAFSATAFLPRREGRLCLEPAERCVPQIVSPDVGCWAPFCKLFARFIQPLRVLLGFGAPP